MAMLTFLRIGKEIYDETEEYLIAHLVRRRQTGFARWLAQCRSVLSRGISGILKRIGVNDLL
jgi:hypothetical protein